MTWSLDFSPVVPTALIALLAVAAIVLVSLAIARGLPAAWLRAITLVALTIALANPIAVSEERDPLPTTVALVVDRSASQALEDRTADADRAVDHIADAIAEMEGVELRIIEAGGGAADGTELFAAADTALADVAPGQVGGVIMVTDGQVHDAPETIEAFGGAPLHAIVTGREDEVDRRIEIDAAPRFGIVGEPQTISYRVVDVGGEPGRSIAVEIFLDGELVGFDTAIVGAEEEYRFVVPHGGEVVYEFVAGTLGGELTDVNNRAIVELDGIRENLRVLLVSGEPHAGERVWRNLLKSDTSVDLIHFTILRPPEKIDITPREELALIAFPTRELFSETLDDFDLLIFDRYQEQGALPWVYFDNMVRYVENGGALLIAAGPDDAGPLSIYSTNLASVLPATPTGDMLEEPYLATVNDLGQRHPVTRDLAGADESPPSWSRWFRIIEAVNPVGDVVMEGPDERPLLVLGHEGDGRVAMLLSDHVWLWARDYDGGGPHADLLRRIAHWLMKEPDLEEEVLRADAAAGLITIERQTMGDDVGPVILRSPLGVEENVALERVDDGLWRTVVEAGQVGLWRLAQDGQVAVVHVGPPNPREYVDPTSTEAVLGPLVDASNGYVGRSAGDSLPRVEAISGGSNYAGGSWLGVRMTEASILTGIDRYPLIAGFLGLALLTGLLAATWFREGR